MLYSLSFNGIRKNYLFFDDERKGKRQVYNIKRNFLYIPGMTGAYLESTDSDVLVIEQPIFIKAESIEELQKLKEDLSSWLVTDEAKELIFDDEKDRVYYAVVSGSLEIEDFDGGGEGTITFVVPEGRKYGPEREIEFSSDIHTIRNNGTAATPPIFELAVKEPTTYAMIQNQDDEYMMIGTPYDVEAQEPFVREEKTFDRIGNTTTGWSPGTQVDGGVVSGGFYTDGQAWRVTTYGSAVPVWRGPALQTSLPSPLSDFKVDVFMTVKPKTLQEFGRAELYLLNTTGNRIGKLAMKNIGSDGGSNIGEINIRNESEGKSEFLIKTYGIRQRLWNDFYGLLRIERENGVYRSYIGMIDTKTGKHHTRWNSEPFADTEGIYSDPLAGVQIHIGQRGEHPFIRDIAIHRIIIYKINPHDGSQIPYIAYPNDLIEIDCVDRDIRINGESRRDLLNFGATYFNLKKGENQLIVMPENAFDVKCKYREGYE